MDSVLYCALCPKYEILDDKGFPEQTFSSLLINLECTAGRQFRFRVFTDGAFAKKKPRLCNTASDLAFRSNV